LLPLLRVLVSTGLLCAEAGRFKNSAEAAQFLVRGQTGYIGGVHELWNDLWRAELQTARSVRSGVPQVIHDYAAMSSDEIRALLRGLRSGSIAAARALMAARDLSGVRRLLDVGGGPGGLALTFAEQFPWMCAAVVALDIVREAPAGAYDVAVCNRFIQVLAPDDAARAIANVATALEPGGALYIMGHILDDGGFEPPAAVSYGLFALNVFRGGQAFTEQQHREWLKAAGLVDITRELLPNGYSLMSARKL
ncbi:MAG: methyltransferase domain-containing protein, partial [Chloroflexi bacterium]